MGIHCYCLLIYYVSMKRYLKKNQSNEVLPFWKEQRKKKQLFELYWVEVLPFCTKWKKKRMDNLSPVAVLDWKNKKNRNPQKKQTCFLPNLKDITRQPFSISSPFFSRLSLKLHVLSLVRPSLFVLLLPFHFLQQTKVNLLFLSSLFHFSWRTKWVFPWVWSGSVLNEILARCGLFFC